MPPGQLVEKREERCGLEADGRDAHEPGKRQWRGANCIDALAGFADRAPAFLLLLTDVDLNVGRREAAGLLGFPGQGVEERLAVERVDHVEQPSRVGRLVRLEPA